MLTFGLNVEDVVVSVSDNHEEAWTPAPGCTVYPSHVATVVDRNDILSWEDAERIAKEAEALMGKPYLPTDEPHVRPRFDVIEGWQVGENVSRGFNGDYYPCGKIVRVHGSGRIVVTKEDDGKERVFYRRKKTRLWLESGGSFALVRGTLNQKNPHF